MSVALGVLASGLKKAPGLSLPVVSKVSQHPRQKGKSATICGAPTKSWECSSEQNETEISTRRSFTFSYGCLGAGCAQTGNE